MSPKKSYRILVPLLIGLVFCLTACGYPTPTPGPNNMPYYPGCSVSNLIGHIDAANTIPGPDVIHLDPNCTYTFEAPDNTANVGNIPVRNGLPVITSSITIYGYNAKLINIPEEGEDSFGFFFIDVIPPPPGEEQDFDKFGDLAVYDVMLERGVRPVGGAVINLGGDFIASNVHFYQNYAGTLDPDTPVKGGAIYNEAGRVWVIDNSFFERNQAINQALGAPCYGGAIYSYDGHLQVTSTVFHNNYAEQSGGAIYVEKNPIGENSGMVTIQDSDFTDNHSVGNGGAISLIYESEGAIIVTSNFDQNWSTNYGGAIYSMGSVVDADYNQFRENEADFGGAVYTKRVGEVPLSEFRTSNSYYINNTVSDIGGGIFSENSDLEISDSYFEANSADSCGAIRNGGSPALDVRAGGLETAVRISSSSMIEGTQINFNHAQGLDGGGICHVMGDLIVQDSIISGNTAPEAGGGMLIQDHAELINNLFLINMASNGGGVYIGHPLSMGSTDWLEYVDVDYLDFYTAIKGSDFSSNSSNRGGGGVFAHSSGTTLLDKTTFRNNTAAGAGGGVLRFDGKMFINNSTFSANSAYKGGGIRALDQPGSKLGIRHATFAFNTATETSNGGVIGNRDWGGGALNAGHNTTVENSLFYQNPPMDCQITNGSNYSATNTYASDYTCASFIEPNPQIMPLQDNGGGTMTHALLPISPLIDVLPDCAGLTDDQRGVARPTGVKCDPGSYEFDPENPPEDWPWEEIIYTDDSSDNCDPFEGEEISLVLLNLPPDTGNLPVYLKVAEGIFPGFEVEPPLSYNAKLGEIQAYKVSQQGFPERLYFMFNIPEGVEGTAQLFELRLNDCPEPVYLQPNVLIPVPKSIDPKCTADLKEADCKAAGGHMSPGVTTAPTCVCP
ncbi:MAG: hypothetical protein HQ574_03275 [Chloroflexi bacterium]|nr:hypothetical protein [Chloroflexota bacterium]